MAHNESSFRLEFRKAVEAQYQKFNIWPNSDRFTNGIADLSCVLEGHFYPIEAKFVEKVPARNSTPILDHELTLGQYGFLRNNAEAGASPAIMIGFPDSFLAIPFSKWPKPKVNITMAQALDYRSAGYEFLKIKGVWRCEGLFEMLRREANG